MRVTRTLCAEIKPPGRLGRKGHFYGEKPPPPLPTPREQIRITARRIQKAERDERVDITMMLTPVKSYMGGFTKPRDLRASSWFPGGAYLVKGKVYEKPELEAYTPHTVFLLETRYSVKHGIGRPDCIDHIVGVIPANRFTSLLKKYNRAPPGPPAKLVEMLDNAVWPWDEKATRKKTTKWWERGEIYSMGLRKPNGPRKEGEMDGEQDEETEFEEEEEEEESKSAKKKKRKVAAAAAKAQGQEQEKPVVQLEEGQSELQGDALAEQVESAVAVHLEGTASPLPDMAVQSTASVSSSVAAETEEEQEELQAEAEEVQTNPLAEEDRTATVMEHDAAHQFNLPVEEQQLNIRNLSPDTLSELVRLRAAGVPIPQLIEPFRRSGRSRDIPPPLKMEFRNSALPPPVPPKAQQVKRAAPDPEAVRAEYGPKLPSQPFFRPLLTFTLPTRPLADSLVRLSRAHPRGLPFYASVSNDDRKIGCSFGGRMREMRMRRMRGLCLDAVRRLKGERGGFVGLRFGPDDLGRGINGEGLEFEFQEQIKVGIGAWHPRCDEEIAVFRGEPGGEYCDVVKVDDWGYELDAEGNRVFVQEQPVGDGADEDDEIDALLEDEDEDEDEDDEDENKDAGRYEGERDDAAERDERPRHQHQHQQHRKATSRPPPQRKAATA